MKGEKTGGRQKGTPNKNTQKTRDFINDLLSREQGNILEALESIRHENPDAYLKHWASLVEYSVPKLMRTELVGDEKKPLNISVTKSYDSNEETN